MVNAQQEVRVHQKPFERELNPVVEASAIAPATVEKLEQRLHVRFGYGPPIREPGHSGKNSRGASALIGAGPGLADENGTAARSVFRRSGGPIRTADLDSAYVRVIHVHLVVGNDPALCSG